MLINGEPAELIAVADRAVQYGDGLFETIRCEQGVPRWLERHLMRLSLGCARLQIEPPDAVQLEAEVRELAAGEAQALIKVLYTRGIGAARGYAPRECHAPTRIVSVHPWPLRPPHWQDGFRVALATLHWARIRRSPASSI